MIKSKKPIALLIALIITLSAASCNLFNKGDDSTDGTVATDTGDATVIDGSEEVDAPEVTFDEDDTDDTVNISESSSITVESGKDIVISAGGTYVLSGTATDCTVTVNADDAVVQLVFDGLSLYCSDYAPVYIVDAEKVVITLAEGTVNSLSDGGAYTLAAGADEPTAALFSTDDLTINGAGALTVTTLNNNGIQCKDLMKIVDGSITVNAADDGIVAKDGLAVTGGEITVTSGGDGIKATNDEDASLGYVYFQGGGAVITSLGDGIQAAGTLTLTGADITVTAGGGYSSSIAEGESAKGLKSAVSVQIGSGAVEINSAEDGINSDDTIILTGGEITVHSGKDCVSGAGVTVSGAVLDLTSGAGSSGSASATVSRKGVKATSALYIVSGYLDINTADDALHSNGTMTVSGGTVNAASGDDGAHADTSLTISGGIINITKSYEGIESLSVTISGGAVYVNASDDGINAAGGTDSSSIGGRPGQNSFSSGNGLITINGGYTVISSAGDGVDANGSIVMTAGTLIVFGPTADNNGALDYDGTFKISGGLLVAAGSSGMAQAPSTSSSQRSISVTFSSALSSGTAVNISGGDFEITIVGIKSFKNVVVSSPDIDTGSYTASYGGSVSGTVTDHILLGSGYSGGTTYKTFTVSSITTTVGSTGR